MIKLNRTSLYTWIRAQIDANFPSLNIQNISGQQYRKLFIDVLKPMLDLNLDVLKEVESFFVFDNQTTERGLQDTGNVIETLTKNLNKCLEFDSYQILSSQNFEKSFHKCVHKIKQFRENNSGKNNEYYAFSSSIVCLKEVCNPIVSQYFSFTSTTQDTNSSNNGSDRIIIGGIEIFLNLYNQVFLSYAFDDRLYALCLFLYMLSENILLYVDWLFSPLLPNGSCIERNLSNEISKSCQFLFLRSVNSELKIRGSSHIRTWCSWEIGAYSHRHNFEERFYIAMYGVEKVPTRHMLLDGFKPLTDIRRGRLE